MSSGNGSKPAVDPTKFAEMITKVMPAGEALELLRQEDEHPDPASGDAALKVAVETQEPAHERPGMMLSDPEPWLEAVDSAALLDELRATFERHMALPPGAADAISLWTLMSHCFEAFSVLPMLNVYSPVMRCGKSRLLELIGALAPRPLIASNLTHAVLFRTIDGYSPTVLMDEVETYLHGNEAMRGVLNGGHTKASAVVVRLFGKDYEPRCFNTYCPKVIAGIGRRAPTLEDRSISIELRRRAPGERIEPLRLDKLHRLEPLRRRAARWANDHRDELALLDPEMPDLVSDRARDNWRPLLAIATLAGGRWPAAAQQAALLLNGRPDVEEDAITLLADLRELFALAGVDRLPSDDALRGLAALEERPWSEWRAGQPLSPAQLAALLRPFGIRPQSINLGAKRTLKGYHRHQFDDAFSRYLQAPAGTPVTSLQNGASASVTSGPAVTAEEVAVCREVTGVTVCGPQPADDEAAQMPASDEDRRLLALAVEYLAGNCDAAGMSFGTWSGMRRAVGAEDEASFQMLTNALVARGVTPPPGDKQKCHPMLREPELRRLAEQLRGESEQS